MIELRPMVEDDVPRVARWLREPHVARWWLPETTAETELAELRARISDGEDPSTRMLTIGARDGGAPADGVRWIGWCQWYPYDAYPVEAAAVAARPGDCGLDYAIGDPTAIGRGLGTELIPALVAHVRRHRPGCGFVVAPEAANRASRRVLERAGFALVAVRPVATEPHRRPMAIYRLPGRDAAGARD